MIGRVLEESADAARAPRRCPRWDAAAPCGRTVRIRALQARLARDPDRRSPLTWTLRPPSAGEAGPTRPLLRAMLTLTVVVAAEGQAIGLVDPLLALALVGLTVLGLRLVPGEGRVARARARWEETCFCPRHRVVFVPGEARAVPLADLRPLLWLPKKEKDWDTFRRRWHARTRAPAPRSPVRSAAVA